MAEPNKLNANVQIVLKNYFYRTTFRKCTLIHIDELLINISGLTDNAFYGTTTGWQQIDILCSGLANSESPVAYMCSENTTTLY